MSPMLLLPSVSKITTLLFVLLSFRRATALASPIPIAVPSCIRERSAKSVRTFTSIFNNDWWSVVIGHWVKASPANIVRPILSFSRSDMKSAATAFAASIRFGLRSCASILVDTSIANMMSIPSVSFSPQLLRVCGRARTITINTNTKTRSRWGNSISRNLRLLWTFW